MDKEEEKSSLKRKKHDHELLFKVPRKMSPCQNKEPIDENADDSNSTVCETIRVPERPLDLQFTTHSKVAPEKIVDGGALKINLEDDESSTMSFSEESLVKDGKFVCVPAQCPVGHVEPSLANSKMPPKEVVNAIPNVAGKFNNVLEGNEDCHPTFDSFEEFKLLFITSKNTSKPSQTTAMPFWEIIKRNYPYVDKSFYLAELIISRKRFFTLFRPSRFGKTLFIEMAESFFLGRKELFENLLITKHYPQIKCEPYQVICMDFSIYHGLTNKKLEAILVGDLSRIAKSHDIELKQIDCGYQLMFVELIEKMAEKDEKHHKVVILIDEVEAPLRTYSNEEEHKKNCTTMKNFLTVIKRSYQYVEFCLIVGITNLTAADVFSGFNHVTPLDGFERKFAAIVGFTETELKCHFDSSLRELAIKLNMTTEAIYEDIRRRYNGFRFTRSEVTVYNPCSVLAYIKSKGDQKFFFSRSGGSTFFENQILENPDFSNSPFQPALIESALNKPSSIVVEENILFGSKTTNVSDEAYWAVMFFQIGLLTIQDYEENTYGTKYRLTFSNFENRTFYLKTLSQTITKECSGLTSTAKAAKEALLKNDWENFIEYVNKFIALFPHTLINVEKSTESVFQLLVIWILLDKMNYTPEFVKSKIAGYADLVGIAKQCSTVIFELKIESNPENALLQCEKYVQQFLLSDKNVICIGMQFSRASKRISKFGVSTFSQNGSCIFHLPYEKLPATIALSLVRREIINDDTRKFRFKLTSKKHDLRLPIGKHARLSANINGEFLIRSYTPVNFDEDTGFVDFIIKVYFKDTHPKFPNGGKLSQYIEKMAVDDKIDFRAPYGKLEYLGCGNFSIFFHNKPSSIKVHAKKLAMIAGGTGITPMLQLIRHITKDPEDLTNLSLLYANQTEKDILLRDELEQVAAKYPDQFKIWYTVDNPNEGWKFSTGFVSSEMIASHLYGPDSDTLVLMCGPPPMITQACLPSLDKLGYSLEQLFVY